MPGGNDRDRAPPILGDRLGIIAGTNTDVETGDRALRNAPAPAEESVRDTLQTRGAYRLDRFVGRLSQGFCRLVP